MRKTLQRAAFLAAVFAAAIVCGSIHPAMVAAAPDAKTRGAEQFATKGCVFCHGKEGIGGGRGPDLQLVRKRKSVDEMTKQIHEGGKGMPPFGEVLTEPEIKDIVAYLRANRKFVVVPPKPVEAAPKVDPGS